MVLMPAYKIWRYNLISNSKTNIHLYFMQICTYTHTDTPVPYHDSFKKTYFALFLNIPFNFPNLPHNKGEIVQTQIFPRRQV